MIHTVRPTLPRPSTYIFAYRDRTGRYLTPEPLEVSELAAHRANFSGLYFKGPEERKRATLIRDRVRGAQELHFTAHVEDAGRFGPRQTIHLFMESRSSRRSKGDGRLYACSVVTATHAHSHWSDPRVGFYCDTFSTQVSDAPHLSSTVLQAEAVMWVQRNHPESHMDLKVVVVTASMHPQVFA